MKLTWKIIKESFFVMILASIMSSVGGLTLESLGDQLFLLLPILIIFPALNDLVGDFGIMVSMELAERLHMKKINAHKWWKDKTIGKFFTNYLTVAILSVIYIVILTLLISYIQGYTITALFAMKLTLMSMFSTLLMLVIIFWLCVVLGVNYHKRNIDPSNTLIPLISSFADMGNILVLVTVITLLF